MDLRQSIELLAESNEDLSPEGIISGGGVWCVLWRSGLADRIDFDEDHSARDL
jgi:hypothetical protein